MNQVCDLCGRVIATPIPDEWVVLTDTHGRYALACSADCVEEGWLRYMMVPATEADGVEGADAQAALAPFAAPPRRRTGDFLAISSTLGDELGRWRTGDVDPLPLDLGAVERIERAIEAAVPTAVLTLLAALGESPEAIGDLTRRAWSTTWEVPRRLVPFVENGGDFWCFQRGRTDEQVVLWAHDLRAPVDRGGSPWVFVGAVMGDPPAATTSPRCAVSGVVLR
ncbi:MAG: hypothetical protein KC619_27070 [Myxococcales bacterium]|nr:hypothetical protein [Myxococcales bacterium]